MRRRIHRAGEPHKGGGNNPVAGPDQVAGTAAWHFSSTSSERSRRLICRLTAERSSFVSVAGRWVPYPFQNNLHHLPDELCRSALIDLIEAQHQPRTDLSQARTRFNGRIEFGIDSRPAWFPALPA